MVPISENGPPPSPVHNPSPQYFIYGDKCYVTHNVHFISLKTAILMTFHVSKLNVFFTALFFRWGGVGGSEIEEIRGRNTFYLFFFLNEGSINFSKFFFVVGWGGVGGGFGGDFDGVLFDLVCFYSF